MHINQRLLSLLLGATLACGAASAQATEIGLTMRVNGGPVLFIYGQSCGAVTCTPFAGPAATIGQSWAVTHSGKPQSLFVIAIGWPAACTAVPGIGNSLLLQDPVVLNWGLTGNAPPILPCQIGGGGTTLDVPANTPAGITVRLQSYGEVNSGGFAFGPAIEFTTS